MVLDLNLSVLRPLTYILFVNLSFILQDSTAQTVNPFEVQTKVDLLLYSDTSTDKLDSSIINNPFELVATDQKDSIQAVAIKLNYFETLINRANAVQSNQQEVNTMLLWLMIFLFSILALAVNINRSLISKLYKTSFNLNLFNTLYRENKEENRLMFPLLYGLYFVALAIFLYEASIHFKANNNIYLLVYLTITVLLVYIIRHLSLKIFASLYGLGKEIDHYLFNIICFGSVLAIILIPLDFIIIFSKPEWSKRLLIFGAVLLVFFYILRQLKEIMASSNLWSRSILHFLLYLCAFEITPLILFYVYLQRQDWV